MTAKEFYSRLRDIDKRKIDLDKEKKEVTKQYVDSLPFKVNDHVRFKSRYLNEEMTVWIAGIDPHAYDPERVYLKTNGHKKDGTRSGAVRCYDAWITDVEVLSDAGKQGGDK